MRLREFKYDGGSNMEELCCWGIGPMKMLVGYMDDIIENEMEEMESPGSKMLFIMYELLDKLEELEETILRFKKEHREEEKNLAELLKLEDKGEMKDYVLSLPSIAISPYMNLVNKIMKTKIEGYDIDAILKDMGNGEKYLLRGDRYRIESRE